MRNTQYESWSLRRGFLQREVTSVMKLEGTLVRSLYLLNIKETNFVTVVHLQILKIQV